MSISLAYVRPLTAIRPNGNPYVRFPETEAEIAEMLCLSHSQRMARAPDCCHECITYLIRDIRGRKRKLFSCFVGELTKRVNRIAGAFARGIDAASKEHILWRVEERIFELVLIETPTLKSDFLEVAFGLAVARITNDEVVRHNRSAFGWRRDVLDSSADVDDEENEQLIKEVADNRPGPEAILLQSADEKTRAKAYWKACRAVKNPQQLEAVRLHYCEGMPIESDDPDAPDLVRYFNATARQVRRWIAKALKQMRQGGTR